MKYIQQFLVVAAIMLCATAPFFAFADFEEQQSLKPSELSSGDKFGQDTDAVAIDGTFMAVGVKNLNSNKGAVFLYRDSDSDGNWDTGEGDVLKLEASDGGSGDYFGHAVDIDGNYLIVGAYLENTTNDGSGAAYIYMNTTEQDGKQQTGQKTS